MLVIEVRLYATLRRHSAQASGGTVSVEVPEAINMWELVGMLNIPGEEIKLIMVNGKQADWHTILADSDRVGLFPPVGGG